MRALQSSELRTVLDTTRMLSHDAAAASRAVEDVSFSPIVCLGFQQAGAWSMCALQSSELRTVLTITRVLSHDTAAASRAGEILISSPIVCLGNQQAGAWSMCALQSSELRIFQDITRMLSHLYRIIQVCKTVVCSFVGAAMSRKLLARVVDLHDQPVGPVSGTHALH